MNEECIFPNELKRMRKEAGLLQSDVANLLGHTSTDRISHWEKGLAAPSVVNLFKLSILFGVPAEELYAGLHASVFESLKRTQSNDVYEQFITPPGNSKTFSENAATSAHRI